MRSRKKRKIVIQKKDAVIKAEDALIKEKDALIKEMEGNKDQVIKTTEEKLQKTELELSMLRASVGAEVNLLPILEDKVRNWYMETTQTSDTSFSTQDAFKLLAQEKGKEIFREFYQKGVVQNKGANPIKPRAGESNEQETFVNRISQLYDRLKES